jgi:predicted RNA-binding protein YlxR (DUF448 family)
METIASMGRVEKREPSERTCLVCRTARAPDELLRLVALEGVVVPALRGRGRGAWVCVARSCLAKVDAFKLARALKLEAAPSLAASWLDDLAALAARRVLEAVGLARRQGVLSLGVDAIAAEPSTPGAVVLAARDASERTRRDALARASELPEAARAAAGELASSNELSRASGANNVGAARIGPGPLAHQAAYWLSVWYESRSREGREARDAS